MKEIIHYNLQAPLVGYEGAYISFLEVHVMVALQCSNFVTHV